MPKHKITQNSIAKELNISRKTVSKVFNNASGIKPETKQLVLAKALELGYTHVNTEELIEELVQQKEEKQPRMRNVAFVCFEGSFWGSYWTSIISGLENTLRKNNTNLQFAIVSQEEHQQVQLPTSLTNWDFDGIITCGVFSVDYYVKLKSLGIPYVSLDISTKLASLNQICDIVMVENEASIYTITKSLIERGHRDICFIGEKDSCLSFLERWNGFHRALTEYGLPCDPNVNLTDYSDTKYYNCTEIINKLQIRHRTPTAFVCANDNVAGTTNALKFPPYDYLSSDVMITGFDNIVEFQSLLATYPTVEIFPEEIGKTLAELLLWRMQNSHRNYRIVRLNSKVVFRG